MIEVRDAIFEDAVFIAHHMREADRKELEAAGSDPINATLDGWQTSDWCSAALVDGEPAVIWGIAHNCEGVGTPWLLATDKITRIKKTFLMKCRPDIDRMQRQYPRLFNYVHRENTIAQQWLAWLGFNIHRKPEGPGGMFYLFTKGVI